MTARKVRKRRFRILDELGLMEIVRMHIEGCRSVRELCQHILGPAADGQRVGTILFYGGWMTDDSGTSGRIPSRSGGNFLRRND